MTQEPTKYPLSAAETQYSKALESARKDVECFFGVLKGRFRILKLPILYRKKEAVDNLFFTCCILHNMLHDYDGLDKLEENIDWAGKDGLHDAWIHSPQGDDSSVGRRGVSESLEFETAHDELKTMLITSYTWRKKHDDIVWLSR